MREHGCMLMNTCMLKCVLEADRMNSSVDQVDCALAVIAFRHSSAQLGGPSGPSSGTHRNIWTKGCGAP